VVVANDQHSANQERSSGWLDSGFTRRAFMKTTGALAGAAAMGSTFFVENEAMAENFGSPVLIETDENVDIKYSVCLACHNGCGIRCKVVDGVLVKIDGNPYHPNNMEPHLAYDTAPADARLIAGKTCAKGQAGLQVLYNPFRIKEPLKRVGARGEGNWESISWDQAFDEIVNGADGRPGLNAMRDLENDIDPSAPELGKKVNQVVFSGGRNQHGQKEFTDRFWGDVFGTINKRHDHTSICETSHHVAYALATGKGMGEKGKTKASTDLPNCKFVLWFGADPCAANFPFVPQSRKLINMLQGDAKLAMVDPRFNVAASKADWWLPIKPGTDAALALAIGRWIIENDRHNKVFLQRPHDGAANPTGELNTTDGTFLVKIENGQPNAFLRADEAGIGGGTSDDFVVWAGGAAVQYDTVDTADLTPGSVTVNGFTCKTSFEVYRDRVMEQTIAQYAEISGLADRVDDIIAIAEELTNPAYGRKVSVESYRGPVQHTNGTYSALAIIALNTLLGNYDWQGGHIFSGDHWSETGGKDGNIWTPKAVKNKVGASGVQCTRVLSNYEDSTEFAANGYPARRPWFPLAFNLNYQEIVPSIEDQYPYPVKALILYWNNIAYSTPAGKAAVQRVLADESKIPLIVSIDIEMGETTAYADYILPDSTYFERWSTPHLGSAIPFKASPVRQPVVGTLDTEMNYTPVLPNTKTLEDILIGIGKAMGLDMTGLDPDGNDVPMDRAWDFHRQMIENLALEGNDGYTLDDILARGGRFNDPGTEYANGHMNKVFGKRIHLFIEPMATTKDSITGEFYEGVPKYEAPADVNGNAVDDFDSAFPFLLNTYKQAWHSMARTAVNPWLMSVQPENFVEMSRVDADDLGIRTGDEVIVTSSSHAEGSVGRAYVTETIRPGVVAIAHSFGHWEMSSKAYRVNGVDSDFDGTRAAGIAASPIMRVDPQVGNAPLQDKIGGSVSFYDTRVQVAKV
jgi:anaerobic selenocysteine-containing dehydrogenase